MHSLLLSVSLLGATISVLAAPSPASSRHEGTWDECEARLNGQLPYYVPPTFHFSGNVRRYYVAAEIDPWDYAPTGMGSWIDHIALLLTKMLNE
jgi:hypothetical protein